MRWRSSRACHVSVWLSLSLFGGWEAARTASEGEPATSFAPGAIGSVVANRLAFSARNGESVQWSVGLPSGLPCGARVHDARGFVVRKLDLTASARHGEATSRWDGRSDDGRLVPAGYYTFAIACDGDEGRLSYDPTDSTGGDLVNVLQLEHDPRRQVLRYRLDRPALVRLLVGLGNDGPVLATVVDWVARPTGVHEEPWDGWDASKVLELGKASGKALHGWAMALPVNAVIVTDDTSPPASGPRRMSYLEFPEDHSRRTRETKSTLPFDHWYHDRESCRDPHVEVSAPAGSARTQSGAVLVDQPVAFTLKAERDVAFHMKSERFEVVVYVDGMFVFEEELGFLPYQWTLKPDLLTDGEHVVSIMVRGYRGHFGSASIRVARDAPARGQARGLSR